MPPTESSKTAELSSARVGFISLGCPKALVDTEQILSRLETSGYELVEGDDADVVVINTCGFIDAAKEESYDTIEHSLRRNGRVVVTGCLGANAANLQEMYPDLIAVTGPADVDAVVAAIAQELPLAHPEPLMDVAVKLTPAHYAYLKIAEGCNHSCSFCIIPSMRGRLRSRRVDDVLREAEQLVQAGARELLVISQDTSAYGVDIGYEPAGWLGRNLRSNMLDLCRGLGQLTPWVRLHYVYPYPNVDGVVELMADGVVLPYLDVPFQHAAPRVLKAMRRPGSIEQNLERIQRWRQTCATLTLRSTFIVGFPGETEAEFGLLLDFLEAAQLERAGAFAYSPVAGAAANGLGNQISDAEKANRLAEFERVQSRVSQQRLARWVGHDIEVIVDAIDGDTAICRGPGDAPEIDGNVFIEARHTRVGDLTQVRVEAVRGHDLEARHLGNPVKIN